MNIYNPICKHKGIENITPARYKEFEKKNTRQPPTFRCHKYPYCPSSFDDKVTCTLRSIALKTRVGSPSKTRDLAESSHVGLTVRHLILKFVRNGICTDIFYRLGNCPEWCRSRPSNGCISPLFGPLTWHHNALGTTTHRILVNIWNSPPPKALKIVTWLSGTDLVFPLTFLPL